VHTGKYPLFFLLVLTFSIAAVFPRFLTDYWTSLTQEISTRFCLLSAALSGLFLSGVLYKRLGEDKFD